MSCVPSRTVANETVNHLFILYEERWRLYLSNQTGGSGPLGKLPTPATWVTYSPSTVLPCKPLYLFPRSIGQDAGIPWCWLLLLLLELLFFKKYILPWEAKKKKKVIYKDALLGDKYFSSWAQGVYLTYAEVPRGCATQEIELWDPPLGRQSAFAVFLVSGLRRWNQLCSSPGLPGAEATFIRANQACPGAMGGGEESLEDVRKGLGWVVC